MGNYFLLFYSENNVIVIPLELFYFKISYFGMCKISNFGIWMTDWSWTNLITSKFYVGKSKMKFSKNRNHSYGRDTSLVKKKFRLFRRPPPWLLYLRLKIVTWRYLEHLNESKRGRHERSLLTLTLAFFEVNLIRAREPGFTKLCNRTRYLLHWLCEIWTSKSSLSFLTAYAAVNL